MSCGSGLFSRRFVKSGKFRGVIAADFSESMLTQAKQYFEQNAALDPRCSSYSRRKIVAIFLAGHALRNLEVAPCGLLRPVYDDLCCIIVQIDWLSRTCH